MRIFGCLIVFAALLVGVGSAQEKNPVVIIDTSLGKITVELFAAKAPVTVKNFLQYVDDKHYDGTIFHRVIADFMIQGGGHDSDMREKPTRAPIKNEAHNGLSNKRGTIAMARTPLPDSASAQFYINVKDNPGLDRANAEDKVGYTVFGQVLDGMDVADKIRLVETNRSRPVKDVVIRSVRRK